jgi:hypothetical protein
MCCSCATGRMLTSQEELWCIQLDILCDRPVEDVGLKQLGSFMSAAFLCKKVRVRLKYVM